MPKAAVAQTGFSTGEVSPLCFGVTDNPRYKKGLQTCLNYIPTLQGPIIRRPGTKFCATVKDANNPPILVPFKFSATQNYMLEVGGNYIRFYANNGQVINPSAGYTVVGLTSGPASLGFLNYQWPYYAVRSSQSPQQGELGGLYATYTATTAGAVLELPTPYVAADLSLLRWTQNGDTVYFTHPNYPVYKLQRQGQTQWRLYPVYFLDGPYLAANTYKTLGDNIPAQFQCTTPNQGAVQIKAISYASVSNMTKDSTTGQIVVTTSAAHNIANGANVFIQGVVGTTEANNYSKDATRLSTNAPYWTVQFLTTTTFMLLGSVFTNAYSSGGTVYPAVFGPGVVPDPASPGWLPASAGPDVGRSMALIVGGIRYWGVITSVFDAATVTMTMGGTSFSNPVFFPNSNASTQWFLGEWSGYGGLGGRTPGGTFQGNGFPSVAAFHQSRLVFAGCLNSPQTVDGSAVGAFEQFSPSVATTLTVQDNSAFSFTLNSEDLNPIRWLVSTAQGLLAATYSSEWAMTPSSNSEALTPTNFNAQQTSYYGGAQLAPVAVGNAVLYIQRAARKLREMAYYFSAGTFRSTDLTEISEHITLPGMAQIAVQKETQPLIWGRRTDGALTSLVYNRDDLSLSAGWARHLLGGKSDAAGTPPIVLAMGFIPDPLITFDQMWAVVQRWVNGAKVVYVEYMTKISDSSIAQEDSFQGDCGGTYDVPVAISNIVASTVVGPGGNIPSNIVTTSVAHGLSTGQQVRIANAVGTYFTSTDINGNTSITSAVNGKSFYVNVTTANTFTLTDYNANPISLVGASGYVSSGQMRKMISTLSGVTWLAGETVGVLVDGGIHPDVTISSAGVLQLQYPGAKVQFGYRFLSQGQLLRAEAGAADGTSIGKTRRTTRAAVQMYRTGDLALGTSFGNLIPAKLYQADLNTADNAFPVYSGMHREGLESGYNLESQLCFQQSSMLPGTIQSITSFMEEQDL